MKYSTHFECYDLLAKAASASQDAIEAASIGGFFILDSCFWHEADMPGRRGNLEWQLLGRLALSETTHLNEIAIPATSLQAAIFPTCAVIAACFSRLGMRMVRAISAETVLFAHTKTGAVLFTTATGGSCSMCFCN